MIMRVLISGFEPFGGNSVNPTALIVDALQNKDIEIPTDLILDQVLLPVAFETSYQVLQSKINSFNPDVVIAFGLASKRDAIELENIAVNKIDADIEDNKGKRPQNQVINPEGADTYLATLPLAGIEGALLKEGLPVKQSNSAGTFVCNYVFYRLMEESQHSLRLCGFIHVPQLQVFPWSDLMKAVSVILNYIRY